MKHALYFLLISFVAYAHVSAMSPIDWNTDDHVPAHEVKKTESAEFDFMSVYHFYVNDRKVRGRLFFYKNGLVCGGYDVYETEQIHRSEFGDQRFVTDNGKRLSGWIGENYAPGKIRLREYRNGKLLGSGEFKKRIEKTSDNGNSIRVVNWEGDMRYISGRSIPYHLRKHYNAASVILDSDESRVYKASFHQPAGLARPVRYHLHAVSPNGRYIASLSHDGYVSFWDLDSVSLLWTADCRYYWTNKARAPHRMVVDDHRGVAIFYKKSVSDILAIQAAAARPHNHILKAEQKSSHEFYVGLARQSGDFIRWQGDKIQKTSHLREDIRFKATEFGFQGTFNNRVSFNFVCVPAVIPEWIIYNESSGIYSASSSGGRYIVCRDRNARFDKLSGIERWDLNQPASMLGQLGRQESGYFDLLRAKSNSRKKIGTIKTKSVSKRAARELEIYKNAFGKFKNVADGYFCLSINADTLAASSDCSFGLVGSDVRVNGVEVPSEMKFVSFVEGPMHTTYGPGMEWGAVIKIPVPSGRCRINVRGMDSNGDFTTQKIVNIDQNKVVKRRLFFVGLGTSEYEDEQIQDLTYAAKDVKDLERVIRETCGKQMTVLTKAFTDKQVTKGCLKEIRAFLKGASINDTVIIFMAGHGLYGEGVDLQYYYLGGDARLDELEKTGIAFSEIETLLKDCKALSRMYWIDTCASGVRENDYIAALDSRITQSLRPRAMRTRTASAGDKDSRSYLYSLNRGRAIFKTPRTNNGAAYFSACLGHEYSLESDKLKNGLFTRALIDALGGQGDLNRDGRLSKNELVSYVSKQVAKLSHDLAKDIHDRGEDSIPLQHPAMERDNPWMNFSLPISSRDKAQLQQEMKEAIKERKKLLEQRRKLLDKIRNHEKFEIDDGKKQLEKSREHLRKLKKHKNVG